MLLLIAAVVLAGGRAEGRGGECGQSFEGRPHVCAPVQGATGASVAEEGACEVVRL